MEVQAQHFHALHFPTNREAVGGPADQLKPRGPVPIREQGQTGGAGPWHPGLVPPGDDLQAFICSEFNSLFLLLLIPG